MRMIDEGKQNNGCHADWGQSNFEMSVAKWDPIKANAF